MKYVLPIGAILLFAACSQGIENTKSLQNQIDSLKLKLNDSYKPGFGEFMISVQQHHDKLWLAGQNQNWRLADFEIGEIKESLADIKKYCTDRPETKDLDMIDEPVQKLSEAISQKNAAAFKSSFDALTSTCNNCHRATHHEFNVIKVPVTPTFSNQDFKMTK